MSSKIREFAVPGAEDGREQDFKEASVKLNQGLQSCRAVIENYRSMMGGDGHPVAVNDDQADSDLKPKGREISSATNRGAATELSTMLPQSAVASMAPPEGLHAPDRGSA